MATPNPLDKKFVDFGSPPDPSSIFTATPPANSTNKTTFVYDPSQSAFTSPALLPDTINPFSFPTEFRIDIDRTAPSETEEAGEIPAIDHPYVMDVAKAFGWLEMVNSEEGEIQDTGYIVVDLKDRAISHSETPPASSEDHLIYIPEHDLNLAKFANLAVLMSENEGSSSKIDEVMAEVTGFETGKLIKRASKLETVIADLEARIERLTEQKLAMHRSTGREQMIYDQGAGSIASQNSWEYGEIQRIESEIAKLEQTLKQRNSMLYAYADLIAFQNGVNGFAEGAYEDDILSQTGHVFANYGFLNDAAVYLESARDYAKKVGNRSDELQYQLYVIVYDTRLQPMEKVAGLNRLLRETKEKLSEKFPFSADEMSMIPTAFGIELAEQMKRELSALEGEIIEEIMEIAAKEAEDEPDNKLFQKALAILDRAIADATTAEVTDPAHVSHLVMAAVKALPPFVLASGDAVRTPDFEDRAEYMNDIFARARRVEELYNSHISRTPGGSEDKALANAMGIFGAETYFYSNLRTLHGYDAAVVTAGYYNDNYPESEVKAKTIAHIREAAPHLFDQNGDLLPLERHTFASDAKKAEEIIDNMTGVSGSLGEQITSDIGCTTAGGTAGAVIGGLIGGATTLGVCTTLGAAAGSLGSVALVNAVNADEVDHLKYQAKMGGMKLLGASPQEAELRALLSKGAMALGVAFAPLGGGAYRALAQRGTWSFLRSAALSDLKTIGRVPNIAKRCFVTIFSKNGVSDVDLVGAAERVTRRIGKGTSEAQINLERAIESVLGKAEGMVKAHVTRVLGDETAEKFSGLVIRTAVKRQKTIEKFHRLLNEVATGRLKGQKGKQKFVSRAIEIYGKENKDLIEDVAHKLFEQTAEISQSRAKMLFEAIFGSAIGDTEDFAKRIIATLGSDAKDEALERLIGALGPASAPRLVRLARYIDEMGKKAVRTEELLKPLIRNSKRARNMLDAMLGAPSKNAVRAADPALVAESKLSTTTLISDAKRGVLLEEVRKVLSQVDTVKRLATEKFFEALSKIDQMKQFLSRIGGDLTLETAEGRTGMLYLISADEKIFSKFIDIMTGRKLSLLEQSNMPKAARKLFREAIIKDGDGKSVCNIHLQHAMREILRSRIARWRSTNLSGIPDMATRSRFRTAQRITLQANALAGEGGEEFANELARGLAPWTLARNADVLDDALNGMREEVFDMLAGQLTESFRFTPVNGIFDRAAKAANHFYDDILKARAIDGWIGRQTDAMGKAVLAAYPDMALERSPKLWRKWMLRKAYELRKGVKKSGGGGDIEVGPMVARFQRVAEAITTKFATEELRLAHRAMIPASGAAFAFGYGTDNEYSEVAKDFAIIMAMLGGNYYLQKFGLGATWGMDIAAIQRFAGTGLSKDSAGSDDLIDIQRNGATYYEMLLGMLIQSTIMYGLNFWEKIPVVGNIMANLPLVSQLPLTMNGTLAGSFFRGTHFKPDYFTTLGLPFSMTISTATATMIAYMIKGENLMNASDDVALWRLAIYAQNGLLTNNVGYWANRTLEANNPYAQLTTSTRQIIERTLGLFTMATALLIADVYAGKGDYKSNMDRTLARKFDTEKEAAEEIWDIYAERYVYDLVGVWDRVDLASMEVAEGRKLGFHPIEPSVSIEQERSWHTSDIIKYSDGEKSEGYIVRLAKKDPAGLEKLLKAFEYQFTSKDAKWRSSFLAVKREAHTRKLYYFSLYVKHYAHLATEKGRKEFLPFAEMITRSEFQGYWGNVPLCEREDDIRKAIYSVEDNNSKQVSEDVDLHDLMAHIRITSTAQALHNTPAYSPYIFYNKNGISQPINQKNH